jgi:hypothetical protein
VYEESSKLLLGVTLRQYHDSIEEYTIILDHIMDITKTTGVAYGEANTNDC